MQHIQGSNYIINNKGKVVYSYFWSQANKMKKELLKEIKLNWQPYQGMVVQFDIKTKTVSIVETPSQS